MKTLSKPLSKLRYASTKTLATLEGLKSIIEISTARKIEFWLVLPAVGNNDARCTLIQKISKHSDPCYHTIRVLKDYLPRIQKLHFSGEAANEVNRLIAKL